MTGKIYWFYSSENLSPLVTPAFLETQRAQLLPGQFSREHQNQWVDAADSLVVAVDVDWAMDQGWTEQVVGEPGVRYVMFVDLGAVHDPTVIAVAHQDEDAIAYIDRLVTFQGTREAPVVLAVVESRFGRSRRPSRRT